MTARRPQRVRLSGPHVQLRPLTAGDADALFAASDDATWTYLPYGPYASAAELHESLERMQISEDPLFLTIERGEPMGVASYLRISVEHGVIEIGHIWFGVRLRRTIAATEAIFLLCRHAFDDLGYRRVEWKCDALNAASRRAAERFGFTFEGVFRKHMVVKGRNRDTAWYAIVDDDWPVIRDAFEAWLDAENFDRSGLQLRSLRELQAAHQRAASS